MAEENTDQARIIDITYYSNGFPEYKKDELIIRDNYITQIEDCLSEENKIVFLEGEEDSGKTTLCAQFVKKNNKNTISVFFNPLNIINYTIDHFIENVVSQINFIINENNHEEKEISYTSIEEYRQSLFQIRKALKKNRNKIYLIIDGIEEKINEDERFIKNLFDLVPFGEDIFRIIISGNKNNFTTICPKLNRQNIKPITITGFSSADMINFLGITGSFDSEIQDLFKITKGYPGRLNTLKRLINNEGYTLDKINSSTTYKHWLELDCNSVDLSSPHLNGLFSVISLSNQSFLIDELSKITSINEETIKQHIESNSIIVLIGQKVQFVSNAHKKYFANILRNNKKKIDELLIQYYANIDTINSKYELSKLYEERGEWSKIVNLIDENYIHNIIETTGTLKKVNETFDLGVKASQELNKYVDMWKYSIQGSVVNELDNFLFWESEINARIAIHDFIGAISLAESAVIKVDRLRLLALIARKQKELMSNVDEELVTLIQEIYSTTDLSGIGNKIYDIVADLIYAIPNLAIEMIDKSSGEVSDKNINDWVIAKLSIASIESTQNEQSIERSKKIEAVENLKNPSAKKIYQAISFLVGNYSAKKVLEEVRKLNDSSERLRLLRLWLNNNHSNIEDVDKVIYVALDELIISSSESSVNLDALIDLSYQLPYIKNRETKQDLYSKFRSIDKDLKNIGLTKSKYIYELNLFHTEFYINRDNAIHTINILLKEIDNIDDMLIKLESFSEVYAKLNYIKDNEIAKKINFVYSRILILSKDLFETTANHFKISQNILKTIGTKNPILALKICDQINTQIRREKARLLILESYLNNNLKYIKIDILKNIESSFEIEKYRFTSYVIILERYAEAKNLHFKTIQELIYFSNKTISNSDKDEKLFANILFYKIIVKNEDWKNKLSSSVESQIYKVWTDIEADWERVDKGFVICSELAKINSNFSKKIFNESDEIKKNSWIDSSLVAYTYINSVKLIIRTYTALLATENDIPSDFNIIESLISRIPSEVMKLSLWTEIGINTYLNKHESISKKIFDNHVLPLIQDLIHNMNINNKYILSSFILVHIYNSELANEYICKFPDIMKEGIYTRICEFYLSQKNPFEIYDRNILKYNTNYNELIKAIGIIEKLEVDNNIYFQIESSCKAIRFNKDIISKPQLSTLIEKLNFITSTKLPDKNNIKHNGYKILAMVKVALISKDINHKEFWINQIEETNKITNISDQLFVKSLLLENIPFTKIQTGNDIKAKLFEEVINSLNSLNIHYEYIQRVIDISDIMYTINRNQWKIIVSNAFNISDNLEESEDIYNSKKNLIDSMYRLDPTYAKELNKVVNKDVNENKITKHLQQHIEYLEMCNKIKKNELLEKKEIDNYKIVVRSIYKNLQELNSDKISSKKISEVSQYLPIGNKLPLHEVYPVYMYYLSNCAKTYKEKKLEGDIANIHRDNFREAVNSTNLIEILSQRRKFNEKSFRNFFIDENFTTNKAVRPGTREEALSFIRKWMHEEVENFIIIADPYFQKDDLEILKLVLELNKEIDIDILGCDDGLKSDIEGEYKDKWNKISNEMPPFTNITFCWLQEDKSTKPIHGRWILTRNGGLRLDTSINSLGKSRENEISVMSPNEATNIMESTLKEYITKRKKEINSQRIYYKSFNL